MLAAHPALASATPFGKSPAIILTAGVANDVTMLGGGDSLGASLTQLFVPGNATLNLFGAATAGFAVTASASSSGPAAARRCSPG